MIWQQWVLVVLYTLSALFTVGRTGHEVTKRYTPASAVVGLIMSGLLIWLVVSI